MDNDRPALNARRLVAYDAHSDSLRTRQNWLPHLGTGATKGPDGNLLRLFRTDLAQAAR